MENENIEYRETLSGKVQKIDTDAGAARVQFMAEIRERMKRREITAAEATKLTNDFGRKNPIFVK